MKRLSAVVLGSIIGCWCASEVVSRLREKDLTGQVALITGASRGLGLAIAEEFARHGCRLVIAARNGADLDRAAGRLRRLGADVLAAPSDLSQERDAVALVEHATRHFGAVDILINNAGIITVGPLPNMDLDDFREAMDVNFWATVYTTLAVLPQMRKRHAGRIVNITSVGAKVSVPHLLPYSCSKFAAAGFSEGLRAEAVRDGIHVTTVVPGLMRTGSPLNANFKGNASREYTWFAVLDSLPGLSMSAERAARQIYRATCRGQAEVTLGVPALYAALAAGIAPGLVSDLAGQANRLLPAQVQRGGKAVKGVDADARRPSSLRSTLTALTRRAARRLNESRS